MYLYICSTLYKKTIMKNNKLTIVAQILAKPEKREFVKKELLKLIKTTLAEKGCINYNLHQDIKNRNLFLFYENWESRELWQKHMNNNHLVAYANATKDAVDDVNIYEMISLNKDQD